MLSTKSILCDTAVVIKSQSLSVYMSCRIFTEKLAVAKNNIPVGDLYYNLFMNMSSEVRKTVFGVYNQARQKTVCVVTEDGHFQFKKKMDCTFLVAKT